MSAISKIVLRLLSFLKSINFAIQYDADHSIFRVFHDLFEFLLLLLLVLLFAVGNFSYNTHGHL